ncbi:23S rRNA (adenine(2503)-C(2))-methyltransferase RlmN [Desulfovibrio desulfuricans]|uniref:23S rRNA (adenine(2503)-C(2))-methyltransferase RlmN n=1 Tax=Desulfovibrio desulfuricans TaxID=876 RepID=UPI001F1770FC|nr:23S rRNA (adenine(2503)-C(2))-methyltransferase RlmN [Desulfovibrio desulfuricans]UIB00346.1 23S rRNA (adenine(2503)-C(2))-methyltransferase RlmN [Desulfovibrio desulfuricans]
MTNLLNLTLPDLENWLQTELGERKFRAMQIWQWLWQRMVRDFESMTNISKDCREKLTAKAVIVWPEVVTVEKSQDDTTKFLLRLEDGALVETVLIPSDSREGVRRWTQCVSSQVGCAMACTFCSTGQMGFERNMTMAEILGQILVARAHLGDDRPEWPMLRNIVFMGMGEPLLNMRELMRSLEGLNNAKGLNFSPRRITVSTCGIEKGLRELGDSGLAYLAVSLHAPTQELRAKIMPKAARWPLDEMFEALKSYPLKTREHITFEYLLLGGVNDGLEQARDLARLVGDVRGKLNLIVYNPAEGAPYAAPTEESVLAFEQYLWKRKITAILRKSKGQDIKAACGQLKADRQAQLD